MTTLSSWTTLVYLLLIFHAGYGERILPESTGLGIDSAYLAPGYRPCPQENGVFKVEVPGLAPFNAYCEGRIAGPGWIVIARRTNEERNFFLKWVNYKYGFGDIYGDFFIGLDKLHAITRTQNHELYIHLEDFEGQTRYARYNEFFIENENMQYRLAKVNGFSGDAGDGLDYQRGMPFSTYDRDHSGHCAGDRMGAWWYNGCTNSNLFGLYLGGPYKEALEAKGMHWKYWRGLSYSYKKMVMMVRQT